jgi:serine/threonine protein kinase
MPKQKKQKLYGLKGGKFIGSGGFGCVYDLTDLIAFCQNTNNKAILYLDTIEKKGRMKSTLRFSPSTNKFNGSSGGKKKNVKGGGIIGDYKLAEDDVVENINDIWKNTNSNNSKVIKVLINENDYEQEIKQLWFIRKKIGIIFKKLFPDFYEYGRVEFDKNVNLDPYFPQCDHFKKLEKPILYFIVMDKLSYSLLDMIKQDPKRLTIEFFLNGIKDLIFKMKIMHERGFIHCDIKPNNILVKEDGQFIFTDLGHTLHRYTVLTKGSNVSSPSYTIRLGKSQSNFQKLFPKTNGGSNNSSIGKQSNNIKTIETEEDKLFGKIETEQLLECQKYTICSILKIKNMETLFKELNKLRKQDTFLKYSNSGINSSTNPCAKQLKDYELVTYIDQYAMAITIVNFIIYFKYNQPKNNSQISKNNSQISKNNSQISKNNSNKENNNNTENNDKYMAELELFVQELFINIASNSLELTYSNINDYSNELCKEPDHITTDKVQVVLKENPELKPMLQNYRPRQQVALAQNVKRRANNARAIAMEKQADLMRALGM